MPRTIDSGKTERIANEIPEGALDLHPDDLFLHLRNLRERFNVMTTAWATNRDQAINDDKFVGGDQWEEVIRKERTEEGRPMLTYNLLLTFCNQIVNRARQEWPQLRVKPVETDKFGPLRIPNLQGTKDYSMADVYMGIIRNIEHQSKADHAYITALEHSVQHGFGFFRAQPVWTRDDSFDQTLRIFRIKNSYSVLCDPTAQEVDYSDMQDAFIHTMINKDQFKRKWPEARATSFESNEQGNTYEGWYDREMLRIAEYFYIAYHQDEVLRLNDGRVMYLSDVEEVLDDMQKETGVYVESSRKVKRPNCMWQKMTASDILEGPIKLNTRFVPIFPVLGRELIIDGETRYHSAIRHAKDAQKAYNYWQTAASEAVALAPRAPWILTGKQIEGFEMDWEEANRRNLPYLLYNHQDGVPPPQRIFADQGAIAQLNQAAQQHQVMQDIIGMHEANVGAQSNERSGVAVRERAARGELSTYAFADNLGRAIEHMGRVLIELIPHTYDTERVMRIRMPDDTEDFVSINKTERDAKTGKDHLVHDIGYGKYDVVITTDPSFATQRQEAQQNILETMQRLQPNQAAMVAHLLVKNMDFPGADDVYEILRKLLPDDLKTPDERAADLPQGVTMDENGQALDAQGQPWQKPPNPQEQLAIEEQKAEQLKHEATKATAEAKIETAKTDMVEAQAKLAEIQQGMSPEQIQAQNQEMQQGMLSEMEQMVRQIVEEVMAEHQEDDAAHKAMDVEGQITDAMVDTMRRVKNNYDNKISSIADARHPAAPEAAPQPAVIVQTGVKSVRFNYDDEGIVEAVPVYEGEDA